MKHRTFNFDFKSIPDFYKAFPSEKSCIAYLEKVIWNKKVVSPYDPTSKVYKRKDGLYRCVNTGKNFNVRVGTIFHGSKVPLQQWFLAIYLVQTHSKGITSKALATHLGVTLKTAWFMAHRIRQTFKQDISPKMTSEVELDETFVSGKNKNRHWNKKVKNCQGRSFKDKIPVLGILERGGRVYCKVVKKTGWRYVSAPILRNVAKCATVYTDDWKGYLRIINKVYKHHVVDHGHHIYATDGGVYTNTIEAFWGNYLKRSINGIYNHVAKKHLQRYVDEYCFRYNHRKVSISEQFAEIIKNSRRRHITYKELIKDEKIHKANRKARLRTAC